jgi:hypothetical protein
LAFASDPSGGQSGKPRNRLLDFERCHGSTYIREDLQFAKLLQGIALKNVAFQMRTLKILRNVLASSG